MPNPTDLRGFEQELIALRGQWQSNWLGLPSYIQQVLLQLGHSHAEMLDQRGLALLNCALEVGRLIENDGAEKSARGLEPQYHNRLHIADVVHAMGLLLYFTRVSSQISTSDPLQHEELMALLCIVGHDYMHSGRLNEFPSQIEIQTTMDLKPLMQHFEVDLTDQVWITNAILLTDPARVAKTHQEVANTAFSMQNPKWLTVLVQESDILPSSLPRVGIDLTHRLYQEWLPLNKDRADILLTKASRINFLTKQALFSSPASKLLKIQDMIDSQLHTLESEPEHLHIPPAALQK